MRFLFWAFIHDVSGALAIAAERVRQRAVRAMDRAIDWENLP